MPNCLVLAFFDFNLVSINFFHRFHRFFTSFSIFLAFEIYKSSFSECCSIWSSSLPLTLQFIFFLIRCQELSSNYFYLFIPYLPIKTIHTIPNCNLLPAFTRCFGPSFQIQFLCREKSSEDVDRTLNIERLLK